MHLRIHGDNIIECERALFLIAHSFSATVRRIACVLCLPRYQIESAGVILFVVELFSGHGRWGVDFHEILQSHGSPLREATDAIITKVLPNGEHEENILAMEFCNALPAGNNAWQRHGRALACAIVKIPYLYFADIGGVELGTNRMIKAPRFPNPIIPFSYLTASRLFNSICLPVYSPSPSSSEDIRANFTSAFGSEEEQLLLRAILENNPTREIGIRLQQKALNMTRALAENRRCVDTLRGEQWTEFLDLETSSDKVQWLAQEQNRIDWSKKRAGKVEVTETFQRLRWIFQPSEEPRQFEVISVGAGDIPLCLIPRHALTDFAESLVNIYGQSIAAEFVGWISSSDLPLIVVWITGFKPRGDDSRPDRGLLPLARMLFGYEVNALAIVSGPAKPEAWKLFQDSPQQLARQNGLWESIINLADAVLADSATAAENPMTLLIRQNRVPFEGNITFPVASPTTTFSEQDVDSTIHLLFAHQESLGVFESMCNPPGGNWSGLSLLDFDTGEEYRWTSLPRVSGTNSKRPDHVIQFLMEDGSSLLLAVESKATATRFDHNIGNRLSTYVQQLVQTPPTAARAVSSEWQLLPSNAAPMLNLSVMASGALCWTGEESLENSLIRNQFDIAFAIEFNSIEQSTLLHIKAGMGGRRLLPKIHDLVQQLGGRGEIQIH